MVYSNKVMDHYENPKNVGSLDKSDRSVGTGLVGAPACGDVMKLQIKVSAEGIIEDAKFKTFGCGSAIASSSLVTEWIKGKNIDTASEITNTEIAQHLSLPPVKIHCPLLAEDAVKAAIADYKKKESMKDKRSPITITNLALKQVKALLLQRNKPSFGLKIGIKTGGCSGMSYVVEYADNKGAFDEVITIGGINIIIDPKAIMYLVGTEMDYVDGDFKSGFVFNNPNEKGKCGCGKSFNV